MCLRNSLQPRSSPMYLRQQLERGGASSQPPSPSVGGGGAGSPAKPRRGRGTTTVAQTPPPDDDAGAPGRIHHAQGRRLHSQDVAPLPSTGMSVPLSSATSSAIAVPGPPSRCSAARRCGHGARSAARPRPVPPSPAAQVRDVFVAHADAHLDGYGHVARSAATALLTIDADRLWCNGNAAPPPSFVTFGTGQPKFKSTWSTPTSSTKRTRPAPHVGVDAVQLHRMHGLTLGSRHHAHRLAVALDEGPRRDHFAHVEAAALGAAERRNAVFVTPAMGEHDRWVHQMWTQLERRGHRTRIGGWLPAQRSRRTRRLKGCHWVAARSIVGRTNCRRSVKQHGGREEDRWQRTH